MADGKVRRSTTGCLILFNFKNKTDQCVTWPLSADILARIPKYASKVEDAKAAAGKSAMRLSIFDNSTTRDEQRMLEVFDYLTAGYISPINQTTDQARFLSLTRLLSLCAFASSLELKDLADETAVLISKQQVLTPATFLAVATQCCAAESEIDVAPNSTLGKWIRIYLAAHLAELDVGGYINRITERGGKLTGILVRVLVDTQRQGRSRLGG